MLKGEGKMTSELKASTGSVILQSPDSDDHLRQQDSNLTAAAW
jgi:hypothetical protein